MRLALAALILAASASVTLAQDKDAKKDDALKGDLAKIQGKWTAMVGPEKNIPIVVEFKDKTANILVTVQERELKIKGEIKLDESKTPKEWDWTKFETPDGNNVEDNLAIYKFDGDKLILCSGGPGGKRPTEFKEGDGGAPNLVEFTRVKDEKKEEAKK
jgi:uncharacterized protein (TIGR03067 family)